MKIPPDFTFSQNNLQDFVDCPRRFELRYLENLAWPAIQSEPVLEVERHMLLGEHFHRMVQQHQAGLPAEMISATAIDPALAGWWQGYLTFAPVGLPDSRKIEYTLSAPLGNYRLIAKYDLLAIEPGKKLIIVDWKTNQKKPRRQTLEKRIQSRVYPFLIAEAGRLLNGGVDVSPDLIEMIYWFAAEPQNPEHFLYSTDQYNLDHQFLTELVNEIEAASKSIFPLTSDDRTCRFCKYRSLCERGISAGFMDEVGEEEIIEGERIMDIDFEQISEIPY